MFAFATYAKNVMKVALTAALLLPAETVLLAPQKADADVVVRSGPVRRTTVIRHGPIRRTTVVRRGPLGRTTVVSHGPIARTTVVRRGPLGRTTVVSHGPIARTTVIRRGPLGRRTIVSRSPSGRVLAVGEFRPVSKAAVVRRGPRRTLVALPAGYRTVRIGGTRFYTANGVYYRRRIVNGRPVYIVTTP